MTIKIKHDFDVDLVDCAGTDEMICRAARVSTLGAASIDSDESYGLIKYLMSNRHGSPFEHAMMTFRISAPIFVWREFMRHRIGFSYNEQSGRYMELDGTFYIPPERRNLVQIGKPGAYNFVPGNRLQTTLMQANLRSVYGEAWGGYQNMLTNGIAKEVARICLPVAIYSTAYVTCNPRSLMSFLSLRTNVEGSTFPSYPQWEISQVGDVMEGLFALRFPLTYKAYNVAGRVSP